MSTSFRWFFVFGVWFSFGWHQDYAWNHEDLWVCWQGKWIVWLSSHDAFIKHVGWYPWQWQDIDQYPVVSSKHIHLLAPTRFISLLKLFIIFYCFEKGLPTFVIVWTFCSKCSLWYHQDIRYDCDCQMSFNALENHYHYAMWARPRTVTMYLPRVCYSHGWYAILEPAIIHSPL